MAQKAKGIEQSLGLFVTVFRIFMEELQGDGLQWEDARKIVDSPEFQESILSLFTRFLATEGMKAKDGLAGSVDPTLVLINGVKDLARSYKKAG